MSADFYELPNNVLRSVPEPKVTVRTLAYNQALYIGDCIEGVLKQETSFPFEYIIGEDNSTDGTREIIFEYARKYSDLIRVITSDQNVGGISNAYRSDKQARGEYIAICEGDDLWTDPEKLEKQITLMEEYKDCHLSFHSVLVEWMGADLEHKIYKRHADHNHLFPVEKVIVEGGEFCPSASLVFKRESRQILGDFFKELPVGDYFTQVSASMNGGALYIDKPMALYRKGVSGSWSEKHSNFIQICRHSLKMINAIRQFDQRTGYVYHKYFKKREDNLLKKYTLFKTYDHDSKTVEEIKLLIDKETEGSLKRKCYRYLFFSFLYYRLKLKELFKIKHWFKKNL